MKIFLCSCIYICLLLLWPSIIVNAQQTVITGRIVSSTDQSAVFDADIRLLKSQKNTVSQNDGSFRITATVLKDTLIINHVGFITVRIPLGITPMLIAMKPVSELEEVIVQTGYQTIPKERSTGSFVQIDRELINRKVSTNIIDRLDGVTSGLNFNRNKLPGVNESSILIRGRSTIFGQVDPLIVVDNFPYDGDINNINPNEVESITILKDASAASIWGVRSGNGVIVITTKKGKPGHAPKVSFNSNLTIGKRPDLYYQSILDSKNYIDIESFLFGKGYYNSRIASPYLALSPAVEIFSKRKNGLISASDSAAQINALIGNDVRNDLNKYFYRPSVSQQYALSISGGTTGNQYFLLAGYDKTLSNLIPTGQQRVNINAKNTIQLIPNKLEVTANVAFTSSTSELFSFGYGNPYPIYQRFVDNDGNALPVYNNYRKSYLDTIGQGQLLDWVNRPYDEIRNSNNFLRLTDYRITASLKYKITSNLDFNLLYQFQDGRSVQENVQGSNNYFARDLVNRYTQVDYVSKNPVRNIPLGNILDNSLRNYSSNSGRALVNYNGKLGMKGQLTLLAGTEIKDYHSFNSNKRLFGYNPDNATDIPISPAINYPTLPAGLQTTIPTASSQSGVTDRYLSYFANGGYTYRNRYLLNVSARKDESNLFGVNANQKGVPLWSAGIGWIVSNENFFSGKIMSYLKLRTTFGYNGNVDKSTSAYTTANVGSNSVFSQPYATVINPPNPDLSWEKTSLINIGGDFGLFGGKLQGTLEAYYRKGTSLIGLSQVASQTGTTQFRQNIADISGKGLDFTLTAIPVDNIITWSLVFLYSYNTDRIDRYLLAPSQIKQYVTGIFSNPLEGKSWSALYAYRWNGLSSTTGDPQGYVAGGSSTDYAKLTTPSGIDDIIYMGAGRPTHFGSLRNSFSYKRLSLSFNIMYQLGYYFRRNAVNYSTTFSTSLNYGSYSINAGEIARRWQKPGDELTTNVPSMIYPAVSARDEFYQYSEAVVEKGDHIRLRDIQLGYDLDLSKLRNLPFKTCKIYLYANNIGILWRANHSHIDPDAVTGQPAPLTISAGINIDFK